MIRLSTKGRYGMRLMLNLALNYEEGKEAVVLKSISEEEALSIRYLEQIIIPLKLRKFVKSVRGAGGGYTLARPPSQITVCEILEVLEGFCTLVDCVEDEAYCDRRTTCATYELWKEASALLHDYFSSKTLQDLIAISKAKQGRTTSAAGKVKAAKEA